MKSGAIKFPSLVGEERALNTHYFYNQAKPKTKYVLIIMFDVYADNVHVYMCMYVCK